MAAAITRIAVVNSMVFLPFSGSLESCVFFRRLCLRCLFLFLHRLRHGLLLLRLLGFFRLLSRLFGLHRRYIRCVGLVLDGFQLIDAYAGVDRKDVI